MSQLDTYRKTVTRKREELAKLSADLSKEQAKISPLQNKIAAIMLAGISQEEIPQLFKRDDVELNQVILVNPD